MRLIQLFITWIFWIDNQRGIRTSNNIETTDLEDGHPNHQLWRKMIDISRPIGSDR